MKKIIVTLLFPLFTMAHTMVLSAIDNKDGTMKIDAMFSIGQSTEGANFKLVSIATSEILYEKRIPSSGNLIINVPKEAYKMILDSGFGHIIEKDGDIEPIDGFKESKVKNINIAFYITLTLSVLFIIAALILQFFKIKK